VSGAQRIAVLGGGAWATALALVARRAGHDVNVWARDAATVASLREGRNPRYLPDVDFTPGLAATDDLEAAVSGATHVVSVVPAQATDVVLGDLAPLLAPGVPVVLCAKGIDKGSGKRLSELAATRIPRSPILVLSGPSFATDVARGLPTAVVVAADTEERANGAAALLSSDSFRCYSSDDVTGVEIGGALKNVYAIAAGAVIGAGMGASAQAALVTRGFVEMRRIGEAVGARPETLFGLSGLGDLVLTCASAQSRNFAYGLALGGGASRDGLPLAEGVATTAIAARIVAERGIEAPILAAVDLILQGRASVADAVQMLMTRPLKAESEPQGD